jgi:hypothetical protein
MSLPDYTERKESIHDVIEFDTQETKFLYEIGRIFSSSHDMKTC